MYYLFNDELDTFITFNNNQTTDLLFYLISTYYKDLNYDTDPIFFYPNDKKRKRNDYYELFNYKYYKLN